MTMNTHNGQKQTVEATIATFSPIAADATDELPTRIHLLRVGNFPTKKYGNLEITASDCTEMVSNFKKGVGLPFDGSTGAPVNFAHQVGLKAAAWIKDLEFDGTDLWGTQVEWSTAGERAIKGKEYKCFSSEFHPRCLGGKWANPENTNDNAQNVFTGGALTNVPMFTGNRPVTASATSQGDSSEKQIIYISASDEGENHMLTLDAVRGKAAADLNDDEKAFVTAHAAEFTKEEQEKFGVQASSTTTTTVAKPTVVAASAVTGDEGVVAIQASEVKAMNDRIAALEASSEATKKQEATEFVKKHIERGAVKADQLDKWVGLVVASDDNRDLLENLNGNTGMAGEKGKTGDGEVQADSAFEEARVKAQKVVADSNGTINENQAIIQVLASDEDLAKRVEDERGNKVQG